MTRASALPICSSPPKIPALLAADRVIFSTMLVGLAFSTKHLTAPRKVTKTSSPFDTPLIHVFVPAAIRPPTTGTCLFCLSATAVHGSSLHYQACDITTKTLDQNLLAVAAGNAFRPRIFCMQRHVHDRLGLEILHMHAPIR